ncbi:MAG: DUF4831 family protein [Muribaculaceae bacterium]|nr:DUF4831 family protein [Muribaculaceae bacterium]
MYKLSNFFTIAALSGLMCMSVTDSNAQTVQKFSGGKAGETGITYNLPNTAIDITIETELTVKKPGELYKYARRYFNISDPITKESAQATVKNVVISTHGISAPDQAYVLDFKSGKAPFMMLDPSGFPMAVNTENLYDAPKPEMPVAVPPAPTALEGPAARQALSEEIMQSQSTAKRAELVAAQIFALRQSRNDFITGQADQMPPDGKAMELILNTINAQEAALMAMFTGTTQTWTTVNTITYAPDGSQDIETRRVIARVSPVQGLVDSDDLSGTPVYMSLKVVERPEKPKNEKGQVIEIPKDGFIYRLPGKVNVTVSYDNRTLADATLDMAQFGINYGLKPNVFIDKKAPAYVIFDPATGAIVELGTVSQ